MRTLVQTTFPVHPCLHKSRDPLGAGLQPAEMAPCPRPPLARRSASSAFSRMSLRPRDDGVTHVRPCGLAAVRGGRGRERGRQVSSSPGGLPWNLSSRAVGMVVPGRWKTPLGGIYARIACEEVELGSLGRVWQSLRAVGCWSRRCNRHFPPPAPVLLAFQDWGYKAPVELSIVVNPVHAVDGRDGEAWAGKHLGCNNDDGARMLPWPQTCAAIHPIEAIYEVLICKACM